MFLSFFVVDFLGLNFAFRYAWEEAEETAPKPRTCDTVAYFIPDVRRHLCSSFSWADSLGALSIITVTDCSLFLYLYMQSFHICTTPRHTLSVHRPRVGASRTDAVRDALRRFAAGSLGASVYLR